MSDAQIAENNDRFCAALGRRDMQGLLGFYDPEVILLIPGAPAIRGHRGVRDYYSAVFSAGVQAAEMETFEIFELGGAMVEMGTYTMTLAGSEDAPQVDTGKYFVVHRKQANGDWAMWLDMFHSDTAAQASGG
jgi:ketosteroid isomerase-like protein